MGFVEAPFVGNIAQKTTSVVCGFCQLVIIYLMNATSKKKLDYRVVIRMRLLGYRILKYILTKNIISELPNYKYLLEQSFGFPHVFNRIKVLLNLVYLSHHIR